MNHITCENFSRIINIAIASSKVKEISLPHMKLRPFMHVLIYGEIGVGKSTVLFDIGNRLDKIPIRGITSATLLGAVDKSTGIFSYPYIWDCRNSVLLIDEYHLDKFDNKGREILNTLLTILENPKYKKKIGYRCNDLEEKDDDIYCIVKNNEIRCKSRFVMIMNTMMPINDSRMFEIQALKSRCIVIPFFLSFEELEKISEGQPIYKYKEIKIKKEIVKIPKKKYNEIREFVKNNKVPKSRYLRLIGDLCRVYAVLGKIDKDIFNIICKFAE